ncbi:VWA domain-containing protein [uncultured Rhodoblastus sp.]|uniref:nitric oxide reductase activation protein NorD n=1 Tax=uncultured Rhodoblastus sp. TaxID=543037 RepID=UPI0025EDA010|nr:VWA domain-containing protein [uncultured Rhodoblastus sp.]
MSLIRAILKTKFWEPEETVGKLWNSCVERLDAAPKFPLAAVELAQVKGPLGVLFRGLGGESGVEIKAGGESLSQHRRSWRRRFARDADKIETARFDGSTLLLPEKIDAFASADLNRQLYLWLAALAVAAKPCDEFHDDPLRRDIARLCRIFGDCRRAMTLFPGLTPIHENMARQTLEGRVLLKAPPLEMQLETAIRERLAGEAPKTATALERALAGDAEALQTLTAPASYKTYRPVLIWGERTAEPAGGGKRPDADAPEPGENAADGVEKTLKAERRKSDQADRRDSLILHRFESILSFADFLNVNRDVDDDDEDSARKAAADAEKIGLAQHRKKPKTRLRFDLDLSPEDGDREKLAGRFVYPEWDWKKGVLVADQTRVLENIAVETPQGLLLDPAARRRIDAVRRQFEALRPKRKMLSRQSEGSELDLDEFLRAKADRLACGHGSESFYRDARNEERDLAVAILFDCSRSTESAVNGQQVIAVAREALVALARGLQACGDDVALYAFSSLRKERVFVDICKSFDEPFGAKVDARIAALKPGFYTRLGAAMRHVSFRLGERPNARKLLLVITDGKPNDLDHYEGRFGVEDTRRAAQEARRRGHSVFCVAIDPQARSYLPHLFGPAGFSIVAKPEKLSAALPAIYRHLVG